MEKHDEDEDIHGEGTAALDARTCWAAVRTELPDGRLRRCRDGCCATPLCAITAPSAASRFVCKKTASDCRYQSGRFGDGTPVLNCLFVIYLMYWVTTAPEDDHARRHAGPPRSTAGSRDQRPLPGSSSHPHISFLSVCREFLPHLCLWGATTNRLSAGGARRGPRPRAAGDRRSPSPRTAALPPPQGRPFTRPAPAAPREEAEARAAETPPVAAPQGPCRGVAAVARG